MNAIHRLVCWKTCGGAAHACAALALVLSLGSLACGQPLDDAIDPLLPPTFDVFEDEPAPEPLDERAYEDALPLQAEFAPEDLAAEPRTDGDVVPVAAELNSVEPPSTVQADPPPAAAASEASLVSNAEATPVEPAAAVETANQPSEPNGLELSGGWGRLEDWTSPEGLGSSLQMLMLLTVISLAPAVLMMTTCFVRIVVVLSLLRQALGTQQLPPNQVMTSLALFMTLLVMSPVWTRVYNDAIAPYAAHEMSLEEAWDAGVRPVRQFMSAQIDRTGNSNDVWLFYKYLPAGTPEPSSYDDVPLSVLLPAFLLSELKTAFLIGFQIYLPFLVLDIVVASVTISMGMMMLPPVLVSLPLKLLLFVLVDGWRLVVGMLLESFQAFT